MFRQMQIQISIASLIYQLKRNIASSAPKPHVLTQQEMSPAVENYGNISANIYFCFTSLCAAP